MDQCQLTHRLPVNRCGEQTTVAIIGKDNIGPLVQRPLDPGTQPVMGKHSLGDIGHRNWIADIGIPGSNLLDGQVVGIDARS